MIALIVKQSAQNKPHDTTATYDCIHVPHNLQVVPHREHDGPVQTDCTEQSKSHNKDTHKHTPAAQLQLMLHREHNGPSQADCTKQKPQQ
jgi:hypothetical protein